MQRVMLSLEFMLEGNDCEGEHVFFKCRKAELVKRGMP